MANGDEFKMPPFTYKPVSFTHSLVVTPEAMITVLVNPAEATTEPMMVLSYPVTTAQPA